MRYRWLNFFVDTQRNLFWKHQSRGDEPHDCFWNRWYGENVSLTIEDGIIDEVILGCMLPVHDKNEIINLLRSKSYPIILYQAKMKDQDFGLDLVKIDY